MVYKDKEKRKEFMKAYLKVYNQRPDVKARRKIYCQKPEVKAKLNNYSKIFQRNNNKKNRLKILEKYGNRCICCGETNKEFLGMDHINNDACNQKKNIRSGKGLYLWIIRNNFPKDFQILCHNCNFSKGLYGYCPHKQKGDLNSSHTLKGRVSSVGEQNRRVYKGIIPY